jgi:hypothetical protein
MDLSLRARMVPQVEACKNHITVLRTVSRGRSAGGGVPRGDRTGAALRALCSLHTGLVLLPHKPTSPSRPSAPAASDDALLAAAAHGAAALRLHNLKPAVAGAFACPRVAPAPGAPADPALLADGTVVRVLVVAARDAAGDPSLEMWALDEEGAEGEGGKGVRGRAAQRAGREAVGRGVRSAPACLCSRRASLRVPTAGRPTAPFQALSRYGLQPPGAATPPTAPAHPCLPGCDPLRPPPTHITPTHITPTWCWRPCRGSLIPCCCLSLPAHGRLPRRVAQVSTTRACCTLL